jgi:predicted RNase H-like HicB family nuclease
MNDHQLNGEPILLWQAGLKKVENVRPQIKQTNGPARLLKRRLFKMNLNVNIEVWRKGKWYVAKCPELDFISQGKTREEAKNNLLEVIQIQFEEMSQIGALDEYLAECGYEKQNNTIILNTEMIGFEKHSLQVA